LKNVEPGLYHIDVGIEVGEGNAIVTPGGESLKVGTKIYSTGFSYHAEKLAKSGLTKGVAKITVAVGKSEEEAANLYDEYIKKLSSEIREGN
jgi:hypothetical protein